jgi:hypothetical protein
MTERNKILWACGAAALIGYASWTTGRIVELQAQLGRLEASHSALGHYTFDFGSAMTRDERGGIPGPQLAKVILKEMQYDALIRPALEISRTKSVLIRSEAVSHNSIVNTLIR